jgi:hypothetical protein
MLFDNEDYARIINNINKPSDNSLIKIINRTAIKLADWQSMIYEELSSGNYKGFGLTGDKYLMLITPNKLCVNISDGDTIDKHLLEFEEEKIMNLTNEVRKKDFGLAEQLFTNVANKYREEKIKEQQYMIEELKNSKEKLDY